MKTFRRDKLFRLVEAGQIVAVGSYHFDDMHGGDRSRHENITVAILPPDFHDRKEGVFYVMHSDFKTSSGCCYLNEDETICHLSVHGNCNYDFRMKDGGKFTASSKAARAQRPENRQMQDYLNARGIDCTPKYIPDGSLRGNWRLYNAALHWTDELADTLNRLGFTYCLGGPLDRFSGNGGLFCTFVHAPKDWASQIAV